MPTLMEKYTVPHWLSANKDQIPIQLEVVSIPRQSRGL